MAVASLLIDSANTRTFGIPRYGFSARENISPFGGIMYNCAHFIDIRTIPDENGKTTLVESVFFRLSLNEDTYNFTAPSVSTDEELTLLQDDEETKLSSLLDEDTIRQIVWMVNHDKDELETNKQLLHEGKDANVFQKYYPKVIKKI